MATEEEQLDELRGWVERGMAAQTEVTRILAEHNLAEPDEIPPNLRDISIDEAIAWKSFGMHVLTLCDSPFAEWVLSPIPGLGHAGAQVRLLAERHGVHR